MKLALDIVWRTVILLAAAFAGFIWGVSLHANPLQRVLIQTPTHTRAYDFNWIVAAVLVYVLMILIGFARKHLRTTAISATIALVITIAGLALFTQIGIKDIVP